MRGHRTRPLSARGAGGQDPAAWLAIAVPGHTAYQNTISPQQEERSPGNAALEWRIGSLLRRYAMAMVVQANRDREGIGGHIASYASSATLYEVGFKHLWRAPSKDHGGALVFIQGHSAPGIYARAYLEGRISEKRLHQFGANLSKGGLSSYPHAWLMPDFWPLPTVSMGLGPTMGVYQARFLKYLHNRGIANTEDRNVWVFCGDGEMDEPESLDDFGLTVLSDAQRRELLEPCSR